MAYSDSSGNNAQLPRRTITGVTNFSGRSRRTEVFYYWVASTLVSVVFNFAMSAVAPLETSLRLGNALHLVLLIPAFALIVRRVHDQNRSGWWGALLPASVLLSVPRIMVEFRGDVHAIIAQKATPVDIISGVFALAVFILCLLPGTEGINRYGSDPRLDEV